MGQTLTHGVYLPDEGERNCYSGLAANWQLLDSAVGTVAEHTTQIAGKAPAVHTHTKADITDFPVYGNTAGTICEGNDSRLSDARTPVAHTHGKADITNLFNSANTWTGDNTYTAVISYQTSYTLGNLPQSADAQQVIRAIDTAGTNYLAQISTYQDTVATGLRFTIRNKFDSNGFSPSGSNRNKHFYFLQGTPNQGYLQWDGYVNNSIVPLVNNTYDLGNSSYKWKSFNGINPGALSLPSAKSDRIAVDVTNWDKTNYTLNSYSVPVNGWMAVVGSAEAIQIENNTRGYGSTFTRGADSYCEGFLPVGAGDTFHCRIKNGGTNITAFLYPCLGNV